MDGKRARNVATSASVRPADQTVARPKPEGCGAEAEGGQPNLLSCNIALRRMEADGVIWLPLPTKEPIQRKCRRTAATEPQAGD